MEITKKVLIGVVGLLIIYFALFPRSAEVLSGNYVFGFDQGRDYLVVKQIVEGKLTLVGSELGAGAAGLSGIFHGPGHYYLLAVGAFLSHGDPYSGIVIMFIFSVATVIMSFYLAKKVFGLPGALIAALLVAISPVLVSQARFVWNSHASSLFVFLVFYFVYQFIQHKKYKDLFWAGFISGFIYNFQTGIAIPLCVTLVLYTLAILRVTKLKAYAVLLLSFFVAFSPMILFEIKHGFQAVKGYISYLQHPPVSSVKLVSYDVVIKDHFGTFVYNFFNTIPSLPINSTLLFIVFISGLVYYIIREKKKERKLFLYYLMLVPFITFFIFSFLKNSVYPHYLTHLNIIYILLVSYLGYSVIVAKSKIGVAILSGIFALLVWQGIPHAYTTFIYDYNDYGGDAKMKGKKDAIMYIYQDAKNEKFNLLVFTPPVYTYAYDYMLWWYGNETYYYMPGTEKKGLVYLLIEKDPAKPWSYNGWLDTVIKDGKVISTTTLPSGFIVQKRMFE